MKPVKDNLDEFWKKYESEENENKKCYLLSNYMRLLDIYGCQPEPIMRPGKTWR
jgi:hypothetical protein